MRVQRRCLGTQQIRPSIPAALRRIQFFQILRRVAMAFPPSGTTPRMVLGSTSCPDSGMPGHRGVEHEVKELEGVRIRVATPAMLYRMKKDTLRWKDKIDAAALRERFGVEE